MRALNKSFLESPIRFFAKSALMVCDPRANQALDEDHSARFHSGIYHFDINAGPPPGEGNPSPRDVDVQLGYHLYVTPYNSAPRFLDKAITAYWLPSVRANRKVPKVKSITLDDKADFFFTPSLQPGEIIRVSLEAPYVVERGLEGNQNWSFSSSATITLRGEDLVHVSCTGTIIGLRSKSLWGFLGGSKFDNLTQLFEQPWNIRNWPTKLLEVDMRRLEYL